MLDLRRRVLCFGLMVLLALIFEVLYPVYLCLDLCINICIDSLPDSLILFQLHLSEYRFVFFEASLVLCFSWFLFYYIDDGFDSPKLIFNFLMVTSALSWISWSNKHCHMIKHSILSQIKTNIPSFSSRAKFLLVKIQKYGISEILLLSPCA